MNYIAHQDTDHDKAALQDRRGERQTTVERFTEKGGRKSHRQCQKAENKPTSSITCCSSRMSHDQVPCVWIHTTYCSYCKKIYQAVVRNWGTLHKYTSLHQILRLMGSLSHSRSAVSSYSATAITRWLKSTTPLIHLLYWFTTNTEKQQPSPVPLTPTASHISYSVPLF